MLSFLYTENYKNLKFDGKVDLKNLNIFIGPNGSGKSNLISYLRFLHQCFFAYSDNPKQVSRFDIAIHQLNRVLDRDFSPPAKVRLVYGFLQKRDSSNGLVLDLGLYITQSLGSRITNVREFLYQGIDLEENLHNHLYYYKIHEPAIGMGFEYGNNEEFDLKDTAFSTSIWDKMGTVSKVG